MAAILEFPAKLSRNAARQVHITSVENEGEQYSRAIESIVLLLQQADKTLAAVLRYEAELAAQASVIR